MRTNGNKDIVQLIRHDTNKNAVKHLPYVANVGADPLALKFVAAFPRSRYR
jgi:hypothetical protein